MDSLPLINDFAQRSFRDVADQDYISARMSYKAQLREPFLWSSLQAFEKYLKAILLFNRVSSKGISHDLLKGLERVENINDIPFSFPDDVKEYINYINDYGTNRYLEYHSYLRDRALLKLDKSIWHVRSYCFYMRGQLKTSKGKTVELLPFNLKKIETAHKEKLWYKYSIRGGLLEDIIKKRKSAYNALIWHNFYYGKRQKGLIKKHPNHMSSVNPTLTMHPEVFEELDKLVTFSREVREHYKK
jgi:HEPN domain-containing protein